jgi:hypothetical protein
VCINGVFVCFDAFYMGVSATLDLTEMQNIRALEKLGITIAISNSEDLELLDYLEF